MCVHTRFCWRRQNVMIMHILLVKPIWDSIVKRKSQLYLKVCWKKSVGVKFFHCKVVNRDVCFDRVTVIHECIGICAACSYNAIWSGNVTQPSTRR